MRWLRRTCLGLCAVAPAKRCAGGLLVGWQPLSRHPRHKPAVMAASQAAIREDVAPMGAGLGLPVVGRGAGW
jgi:hypothetical protein